MDGIPEVQFRVLGPLEALAEGRPVALGGATPRLVLAVLLVRANEVVSADRLIDVLWGDAPPDSALTTLQKHVHRLRAAIEPGRPAWGQSARLVKRPPGYLLRVEADECDATRFEHLVADAQRRATAGHLAAATELFDAALALWRGPAWAEFADHDFARAEVARLDGLRAVAVEDRVEVALTAGRHAEVIGELEAITAGHPLRERPRAQLMLALYRCGRHAEALRAYEGFRRYLGGEVGLEPSAGLVQLADAIVLQKPELDWVPPKTAHDGLGAPSPVVAPVAAGRSSGGGSALPAGTVTFLFTDIEGSTRLWEADPGAMRAALARHDEIVRGSIEGNGGHTFSTGGDGFAAAFQRAAEGLGAALDAQQRLGAEVWHEKVGIRVRMALHTGEVEERAGDYYGPAVNRAARLMAAAHGGQVLVSDATEHLVGDMLPPGVSLRDLGVHRLRDLSRPERVFQVVADRLATEFGPLRSTDVATGNLPAQTSSFVGRDEDVAAVSAALGTARVVTLVGVGGVGKTRLALEVAAQVAARSRDGAWLCELAGVRDPDAVPEALHAVFGVGTGPGQGTVDSLVGFLRGKEMLVVLDNCEHLVRAVAALLGTVARSCPEVRVLATSRESLKVAGEQIVVVPPLDVPEDDDDLATASRRDAVRLFVERARAAKPGFTLDESNLPAVTQLCQRLDGVALAIELAAARLPVLTPSELARRLDQRFRVLTGGQRSAVEHHQTMRAAIDWSYDLLLEPERALLDRLSVFAGGFTLEAAETVCSGEGVPADDVLELLAALVARSLVVAEADDGETRYRLLETIRQYAQERLGASGDSERARGQHAAYFTDFLESVAPLTSGPYELVWMSRLTSEADNLRVALDWLLASEGTDRALRLVAAGLAPVVLSSELGQNGLLGAGAEPAMLLPGASEHPKYPDVVAVAAWRAATRGELVLASQRCDDAVAAQRRLGSPPEPGIPAARAVLAMFAGCFDEAAGHIAETIAISRATDFALGVAWNLCLSAQVHVAALTEGSAAQVALAAIAQVLDREDP